MLPGAVAESNKHNLWEKNIHNETDIDTHFVGPATAYFKHPVFSFFADFFSTSQEEENLEFLSNLHFDRGRDLQWARVTRVWMSE